MPLHVAIWSQIVMDSDLDWADQGMAIRLLANAWSSGELARKQWATDAAWQAAERMWPSMLREREANTKTRETNSARAKAAAEARWNAQSNARSMLGAMLEHDSGDARSKEQEQEHKQEQEQEQKQEALTPEVVIPPGKPAVQRETWITPYVEAWNARTGGEMVVKHALKPLAKLRDRHGDAAVMDAWHRYLDQTEVQFCSVTQFAAKYGQWAGTAEPPRSREAEILRQLRDEGPVSDPFEAAWHSRGKALLS